jgi:septal ring factor EnvC (AmiA/AmiB activator)
MTEMQSQFTNELRSLQERVDTTTFQIRELSSQQTALSTQVETAQARHRARQERKQRIQNFRRAVSDMRDRVGPSKSNGSRTSSPPLLTVGDADREFTLPISPNHHTSANLPDTNTLNAHFSTYKSLNASLAAHHMSLKARDTELEHKYRKVVSLCTDVPEVNVDSVLPQLVLAVESETENEVGRIREFLNKYQQNGGPD